MLERPAAARPAAQVFPNPFRHELRFQTLLASRALVRAELRDLAGRTVARFDFGTRPPGAQELTLRPSQALAPGLYVLRISAGEAIYHYQVERE